MNKKSWILALLLLLPAGLVKAQSSGSGEVEYSYFIGTTAFVLYNLIPDPLPPRFAQVSAGRRLTRRDEVSVEAMTWQYFGPVGRPIGPDFESKDSNYPGRVRAYGVGIAYKRNVSGRLYAAVHSTPMLQEYLDENEKRLGTGFRLFNTFRIGYDASALSGRVFIQPSIAATYWPINTHLPDSFQVEEDDWPNYFLFEPGLHVGFRF